MFVFRSPQLLQVNRIHTNMFKMYCRALFSHATCQVFEEKTIFSVKLLTFVL